MSTHLRYIVVFLGFVSILGAPEYAHAQADPQNFIFSSGQTVQPFFEGWAHNPDGSYEMHFGYLNRNYVEETHVPIGPDNRITPDAPDQGQPTLFYPHMNHRVFSVTIPADWGNKELIWQVTVRNETYRAIGWLQAEWEIEASAGARSSATTEATTENQAPTLVVEATRTVTLPGTLTMTATVSDDGLPEARERARAARVTLPTFEPDPDGPTLPVNVPQIDRRNRKRPSRVTVERVNVTWTQWRGPAGARLESPGDTEDGVATVTATFETPGDYLFRVRASDGLETVTEDIAVTVR